MLKAMDMEGWGVNRVAEYVWEAGVPFLVPEAVEYLGQFVNPNSKVFEWGAGGSTVWLGHRVGEVVSIEHQRDWYSKVGKRLEEESIESVMLHFVSQSPRENYTGAILAYPTAYFNLVLVDGRERVSCIQGAVSKVRDNGLLVLDNVDRPRYQAGIEAMRDWERLDFCWPYWQWFTSVFIKPVENGQRS